MWRVWNKSTKPESRTVAAGGGGNEESLFNGYKVSVTKDGKLPEIYSALSL